MPPCQRVLMRSMRPMRAELGKINISERQIMRHFGELFLQVNLTFSSCLLFVRFAG